ncbi:MAG: hypothetical protein MJZ96_04565 [Paludibacteraceae bacterium]|nr:hypothetical protein [Paludibacteraceae bacterium]
MKKFIKDKLEELLQNVPNYFEENELAYITLQQKVERQIRDKIAWKLQKAADNKYGVGQLLVRCEWPSSYDENKLDYTGVPGISGRSAVDIAVLKMNDDRTDYDEVLALIEFKHHAFLNKETMFYGEFNKDVAKMKKIASLPRKNSPQDLRIRQADLYFIMLTTSHQQNNGEKYASAVVYKGILDSSNKTKAPTLYDPTNTGQYIYDINAFWKGFKNKGLLLESTELPMQNIGTSFGYDMWFTGLILRVKFCRI